MYDNYLHNSKVKQNKASNNLWLVLFSRISSDMGTEIFRFAVSFYILQLTKSATLFATVLALSMIPSAIIYIFCGVFIDLHDKRKVLIICDTTSAIISFLLFIFLKNFDNKVLIVSLFVIILSSIQSYFSMAFNALIPHFAEQDKIATYNSLVQTLSAITKMLGPVVGAIIFNQFGIINVAIINGITFLCSAFAELFLVSNERIEQRPSIDIKKYKKNLNAIYEYVYSKYSIKVLLVVALGVNVIFVPMVNVVLPFVAYQKLNMEEIHLSLIIASWSLGMILGAIIISFMKNSNKRLFKNLLLFLQLESLTATLWCFPIIFRVEVVSVNIVTIIYCIIMVITGVFTTFVNIPMIGYIQLKTPENMRASLFGISFTLSSISSPIGMWIFGFLLEIIYWPLLFVVPSLVIVISLAFLKKSNRLKEFLLSF